jgi:hypothetical protein
VLIGSGPDRGNAAKRTWVPRPSERAAGLIVATVRELLADESGWCAGYGVSLAQIRARLQGRLTASTLKNYVRALTTSGALVRVAVGVYALPRRAGA